MQAEPPTGGPSIRPDDDLEAQVRAAEAEVAARDARIALKLHALEHQARQTLPRPRTAMLAAAGAGAGAFAALLFRRARRHGRRDERTVRVGWMRTRDTTAPQPDVVVQAGPRFPWAGLIPLMWPLLPGRWRARMSPATATALAGFVATRLGSRRKLRVRR